jgi:copper chaperone CopZ
MRQLLTVAVVVVAVGTLQAAVGDNKSGEIKGAHICCGQCVKVVKGVLEKVDGLSDLKVDQKTKTVTFTAKDKKAAESALAAMYDAGFAGTGKYDDAAIKLATTKQSNSKADAVTVTGVHACCGQCVKALKGLFPDAEVKVAGAGPQKDVTITGKDLNPAQVLQKLNETGFNGKIDKK